MGFFVSVLKRGLTIEGATPITQKLYVIGVLIETTLSGSWIAHHYQDPSRLFIPGASVVLLAATLFVWLMRWGLMNLSHPSVAAPSNP